MSNTIPYFFVYNKYNNIINFVGDYMISYEKKALSELKMWKQMMRKKPSFMEKTTKNIQDKINNVLPEKYHEIVTGYIKNLTKAVLYGYKYVTKPPMENLTFQEREKLVKDKSKFYRTTAIIEGAATGYGGIVIGLTDFPLFLSIKFKFLYDVASIYGFDVKDYKERLYIINIFQLTFSSKSKVNMIFERMDNWKEYSNSLPDDINKFNWRSFQQEYRDYIDLAKLLQLIPGIGAAVGSYANNKLMKKLSNNAIQAYRMRIFG